MLDINTYAKSVSFLTDYLLQNGHALNHVVPWNFNDILYASLYYLYSVSVDLRNVSHCGNSDP